MPGITKGELVTLHSGMQNSGYHTGTWIRKPRAPMFCKTVLCTTSPWAWVPSKKASERSTMKILAWSMGFQNSCGLVMFHRKVLTLYLTMTVIKSIYGIIRYSFVFISQLLLLIKCSLDFTFIWITLFKGHANGMMLLLKHDAIQNQQWVENCYVH